MMNRNVIHVNYYIMNQQTALGGETALFNVYILIVQTSVEQTTKSYVTIVGKDVDFACLFIASTPPAQDILRWFHKILLEDRSHKASDLGILQLYLH